MPQHIETVEGTPNILTHSVKCLLDFIDQVTFPDRDTIVMSDVRIEQMDEIESRFDTDTTVKDAGIVWSRWLAHEILDLLGEGD